MMSDTGHVARRGLCRLEVPDRRERDRTDKRILGKDPSESLRIHHHEDLSKIMYDVVSRVSNRQCL
jgi:hypothetical protein